MSSFPVNPGVNKTGRRRVGCLLPALLILVIGGFFLYNMLPNLVSVFTPGGRGGLRGEWVGLVTVTPDMMSRNTQPAAVKLTMTPASMGSIIPTYEMKGEMTIGHSAPVTFVVKQVMTSHERADLHGFVDTATIPALEGANISGELTGSDLTYKMSAMTGGSSMSLDGKLKKGTDADYAALINQIQ